MKKIFFILNISLLVACTNNEPVNNNSSQPEKTFTPVAKMVKSSKRGVAFSFSKIDDILLLGPSISWCYNWGVSPWEEAPEYFDALGVEYLPMCWTRSYDKNKIMEYVAAHPSTQYLLGFNEPNLTDQANMTPSVAAQYWPEVVQLAKDLNLKLVSPAMNYGTLSGYHDPVKWMDEFLAQPNVSLDDIDVIALHCYMTSPEAVINFVKMFEKYGKPIWMTEFCAWWDDSGQGSVLQQITYMCSILNYFEQSDLVERYAWFIPRYKSEGSFPYMQLLTDNKPYNLTDAGKVYCNFSSFDKTAYLDMERGFDAAQYVNLSDYKIQVRPTTDGEDGLMVQALDKDQWLEYQIGLTEPAEQITIRYASLSKANVLISVDGNLIDMYELPKTGALDTWHSATFPIELTKGGHTLRIQCFDNAFNLSKISL